jgi:hypothetical protein
MILTYSTVLRHFLNVFIAFHFCHVARFFFSHFVYMVNLLAVKFFRCVCTNVFTRSTALRVLLVLSSWNQLRALLQTVSMHVTKLSVLAFWDGWHKMFIQFDPLVNTGIFPPNLDEAVRSILTFSRLMTYIYMSYRTANLQTLHFIYLINKYTY